MVLAYAIPPGILHKINKFFSDPTLGGRLGKLCVSRSTW